MGENSLSTKKTIGDILKVAGSNLFNLLSGVLVGFLLPKILGVTDYGYYKTFTLYAGYIGLFHFGIVDGIILKFGGKDYEELEKTSFRFYSRFLIFLELAVSALITAAAAVFCSGDVRFILIWLAVDLVTSNLISYYQSIAQITNTFSKLSLGIVIQSALTCVLILVLWAVYLVNGNLLSYKVYVEIFCLIKLVLCLWYVFIYREITFGPSVKEPGQADQIKHFMAIGIPLLVSNLTQNLILNIDRQFVNVLFDTDTYAIYAFAYNMLGLITTATAAIATVLYPSLKRLEEDKLKDNYSSLVEYILMIVFACILVYFPLCAFVKWFLPKYTESLVIFRIILPGLAFSSPVTIIMHNYYKVMGKSTLFFIKSAAILGLSCVANVIAYRLFGTTVSISVASILVMIVWYIVCGSTFRKVYGVKMTGNLIYIFIMCSAFYLCSGLLKPAAGFAVYLAVFAALSLVLFRDTFKQLKSGRR